MKVPVVMFAIWLAKEATTTFVAPFVIEGARVLCAAAETVGERFLYVLIAGLGVWL
jgi:hypothetical protein